MSFLGFRLSVDSRISIGRAGAENLGRFWRVISGSAWFAS